MVLFFDAAIGFVRGCSLARNVNRGVGFFAGQEHLRMFGAHNAREWTKAANKPLPAPEEDVLIIIVGDGWNCSNDSKYYEFRIKFELCQTVGDIMDLPIPETAFLAEPLQAPVAPFVCLGHVPALPSHTRSHVMTHGT